MPDRYPPGCPALEPPSPIPLEGFHQKVEAFASHPIWDVEQIVECQRELGFAESVPDLDHIDTLATRWIAALSPLEPAHRDVGGCDQIKIRPDLVYAASALRVEWLATFGLTQQAVCIGGWLATYSFLAVMNVEVRRPRKYPLNLKAFEVDGKPNGFCSRHEVALIENGGHLDRWRRLIDAGTAINDLEHGAAERLRADRADRLMMHTYQVANLTRVGLKLNHLRYEH